MRAEPAMRCSRIAPPRPRISTWIGICDALLAVLLVVLRVPVVVRSAQIRAFVVGGLKGMTIATAGVRLHAIRIHAL